MESVEGALTATLINVLLPTRERCEPLASALQTCVSQDYENSRFIVSDNASNDETRSVVESFRDPRIVYVNPGRRLSMSENWEFALSHARSGYVTYIGDDDGLLPGALRAMDELIQISRSPVVMWRKADYTWPNQQVPAWRNALTIPLRNERRFLDSAGVLRRVGSFEAPFFTLPMVYNGAIDARFIDGLRNGSGRFFHSRIPDVYSGVAFAASVPRFFYSTRPLSINGCSGFSNSASAFFGLNDQERQEARRIESESNLPFHPALVHAPSLPVIVAESFLQVRDHFPDRLHFQIDMKVMIRKSLEEAAGFIPKRYAATVEALREIGRRNDLTAYVEEMLPGYPNHLTEPERQLPGFNPRQDYLVLDASEFDVRNVAEAARLIHHTLVLHDRAYDSLRGRMKTFGELALRNVRRRWKPRG